MGGFAVVLAILILSGCATPTLQQQGDLERQQSIRKCIRADMARHWPNRVEYMGGIPPQCRHL